MIDYRDHFHPMLLLRSSIRIALPTTMVAVLAGCVSEADRQEATRFRRPVMPSMVDGPRASPHAPAEETVRAAVLQLARAGDLDGAGRRLESVGDRSGRERLAREVAAILAMNQPLEATAFALVLTPGPAQTAALEEGARALARRDGDFALRWALEFADPSAGPIVRRVVAGELVGVAPRATVERLLALPGGGAREELLGLAAAAWARRDADAVEAWLRGLPANDLRQRLTARVGFELAQSNPQRAIALAEGLPPGRDRWLLITAITQTWVAVDAKAAFAWTHGLAAGEAHDAAVAGLDAGLGVAVSRRTLAYPDTRGGSSRRGAGGLARDDAMADDAVFAAWRAANAPSLSRDDAILEYVRQRGAQEPLIIGQWVDALPGGATRNRALEVFWEALVAVSPSEAAQWLRGLPRSDQRPEMVERTAREWLRTDPAAAAAWLRASFLPAERIEWLLRQAGEP